MIWSTWITYPSTAIFRRYVAMFRVDISFIFSSIKFFLCHIEFDLHRPLSATHAFVAPFVSRVGDTSQQAILQGKIRKWVLASYACYESFIPCYLLQQEVPFCQKKVKKNPVIPLYLFVFSIILTIMCLLFIMCM